MTDPETELKYSPLRIIARALDGFYAVYLQLHLPACANSTLQEETKKMVQELYILAPDEARGIINVCIRNHGWGKGDGYVEKHIDEAESWIMEVIKARRSIETQLTESINEHYSEPTNQTGSQSPCTD